MDKTNENKLVKRLVETKAESIKLGIDQHARDVMVVQVPAEEAEQLLAHKRVRDQLQKSVQQWAARGKSLLLVQGYHVTGVWWKERAWSRLAPTLPAWLVPLLETIRTALTTLWAQEQKYRTELAAQAPQDLPKAVGALTWVMLSREICNGHRFKNRRQVSSYTGLCPGVQQSDGSRFPSRQALGPERVEWAGEPRVMRCGSPESPVNRLLQTEFDRSTLPRI